MVSQFRRLQAKLWLAGLFFWHLFTRLFSPFRKRRGLTHFLAQYAADAITPVGEEERQALPRYSRCIACSLCTFSCDAVKRGLAPSDFEPKFLLLGYGRSAHESEYFFEEWLPCVECRECTVKCPTHVPIHAAAQLILERRKRLAFRN